MEKYAWNVTRTKADQEDVVNFCKEKGIDLKMFRYWMNNTKKKLKRQGFNFDN